MPNRRESPIVISSDNTPLAEMVAAPAAPPAAPAPAPAAAPGAAPENVRGRTFRTLFVFSGYTHTFEHRHPYRSVSGRLLLTWSTRRRNPLEMIQIVLALVARLSTPPNQVLMDLALVLKDNPEFWTMFVKNCRPFQIGDSVAINLDPDAPRQGPTFREWLTQAHRVNDEDESGIMFKATKAQCKAAYDRQD